MLFNLLMFNQSQHLLNSHWIMHPFFIFAIFFLIFLWIYHRWNHRRLFTLAKSVPAYKSQLILGFGPVVTPKCEYFFARKHDLCNQINEIMKKREWRKRYQKEKWKLISVSKKLKIFEVNIDKVISYLTNEKKFFFKNCLEKNTTIKIMKKVTAKCFKKVRKAAVRKYYVGIVIVNSAKLLLYFYLKFGKHSFFLSWQLYSVRCIWIFEFRKNEM